ncbi:MAG TPA: hypothetical protein PLT04_00125 [Candidatus Saccharibacteria bacterium]|nr:hypothetical protein [Candidatus Saccharibacteria bacterium]
MPSLSHTVLTIAEQCSPAQHQQIVQKYGPKLELQRGATAQERLEADIIIASHALRSIPERARHKTLGTLFEAANVAKTQTEQGINDPSSRLLRGIGRLCCLGIITEQKIYEATERANLPKKERRRFTKEGHALLAAVIESYQDSLLIAASTEPGAAAYARRIIGLQRKELKSLQAGVQNAEHRIVKKSKRKTKKH